MADQYAARLAVLLLAIVTSGCSQSGTARNDEAGPAEPIGPSGPYFGLQRGESPQVLLPGFVSTQLYELNGTFPPDGSEFFYTSGDGNTIVFTKLQPDGRWSKPEIAPFSGSFSEYDPLFSPDGQRIYFSSHRPVDAIVPEDGSSKSDMWYVEREGDAWAEPRHVGLPNDTERGNYYSSLTHEGDIYFNKTLSGRQSDIFRAVKTAHGYEIERLGDAVNSDASDSDPFISPDGDYLIFRSYRYGGVGSGDLYISFNVDGEWTPAKNLGEPINSNVVDYCPFVTFDGRFLIFTSERLHESFHSDSVGEYEDLIEKFGSWDNGGGNLYWVSTAFIEKSRPSRVP